MHAGWSGRWRAATMVVGALGVGLCTAAVAHAEITIETVAPTQGASGDFTLGPGHRVWGLDGGYGCGAKPVPNPITGATCRVLSINLDGSDPHFYELPPEIVDESVPGDTPTNEELAPFPPLFAQFFNPRGPFCNCPGFPAGAPGRPSGIAPFDITEAPDGSLWFTNTAMGRPSIIKMVPTGPSTATYTVYPIEAFLAASGRTDDLTNPPRPTYGGWPFMPIPFDIETGPDGRIYFGVQDDWAAVTPTVGAGNRKRESWIGRFEPTNPLGTLTTWGVSGITSPLAVGPDGNMWFKTFNRYSSRANTDMINACCMAYTSDFLAFGPDGDVWFTQEFRRGVGRFDPRKATYSFYTEGFPADQTSSYGIAFGHDGALYELDGTQRRGNVVRFDAESGKVLGVIVNPKPNFPGSLKRMPDGTMWTGDHTRANVQKVTGIPDTQRDPLCEARVTPIAKTTSTTGTLWVGLARDAMVRVHVTHRSRAGRWLSVGSLERRLTKGANAIDFVDRLGSARIVAGAYRFRIQAIGDGGPVGAPKVVAFRVL